MSDSEAEQKTKKAEKKHAQDRNDLGDVDNVRDLEPEKPDQVGKSRKAAAQNELMTSDASGYFEIEGANAGGLGAPLHLGSEIKKEGGGAVNQYEAGYNSYATPLRSTLRAMGRLKDVSMTGAPLTPDQLLARPDLAKRFRKLSQSAKADAGDQVAYNAWSKSQMKMRTDIEKFGASQHTLTAAISEYRQVQQLLEERRTEALRDSKQGELNDIKEAAATLAKIVDVSMEAWSTVGEIDEFVESHATLDENAEGADQAEMSKLPAGTDWANDRADGKTPSIGGQGGKKAVDAAAGVIDAGSRTARISGLVAKKLSSGTGFSLSLEDVFVVAMGKGAEYQKLQNEIKNLEKQIGKLKMAQEVSQIRTATERLTGFQMEFRAIKHEIRDDRKATRRDAHTFAQGLGAGNEGIMSTYAAEAWQELASFGQLAAKQRHSMVDPTWHGAHDYVYSYDPLHFAAIGAGTDAAVLKDNLRDVQYQKSYFDQHMSQWQENASKWSEFFRTHTGSPLVPENNQADEVSQAP